MSYQFYLIFLKISHEEEIKLSQREVRANPLDLPLFPFAYKKTKAQISCGAADQHLCFSYADFSLFTS